MRKAYELANSGYHRDDETIEAALAPDYPEVSVWLDRSSMRENLRKMCYRACSERRARSG
jgi:hypothetical protein